MNKPLQRSVPLIACLLPCLLAACNFAPTYAPPTVATPTDYSQYASVDWSVAAPQDAVPRGKWWEVFNDPVLNSLQDQVTTANQNLKVAVAQFDEARAAAKTAQADYYPTLDADAASSRNGLSRNVANPLPNRTYTANSLGLDFSYEVDVWGRVRNQARAGVDQMQASAADLATVALSLHAELATDYFILRGDDAAQDVLDRTVSDYGKALELTQAQFKIGYAASPDVSAAKAQFESAKTQATENQLKRTNLEHAIAILTGQPPEGFSVAPEKLAATPPAIATALPAALLERRPDIAAAERRVAAANAEIGVAKAAWYPSFSLDALFGVQAAVPARFFSAPAEAWSFGPSAVLNLLDGGKRAALNDRARASYDEAVAQYRQTVLNAYGEVEDSLASLHLLANENVTQVASVEAAAESSAQATHLYEGGLNNYYAVIVAENIELGARLSSVDIQTRRMTAAVALIKALGGSWDRVDGLDPGGTVAVTRATP